MGSGKTTIGRRLARGLGWPHLDSDADIEAMTGRTAREIAAQDGIEALHALELRHLLEALAGREPSVISAAASTIDEPAGRAALEAPDAFVVWLRLDPAVAVQRATRGDHRPSPESLSIQAERRDPWFRAVADLEIDAGATRPGAIVRAVLDALRAAASERPPSKGPTR